LESFPGLLKRLQSRALDIERLRKLFFLHLRHLLNTFSPERKIRKDIKNNNDLSYRLVEMKVSYKCFVVQATTPTTHCHTPAPSAATAAPTATSTSAPATCTCTGRSRCTCTATHTPPRRAWCTTGSTTAPARSPRRTPISVRWRFERWVRKGDRGGMEGIKNQRIKSDTEKQNQTIYWGQEPSRNRVAEPARQVT
jgi:hypothetical protein